jgi:hypothetical protein
MNAEHSGMRRAGIILGPGHVELKMLVVGIGVFDPFSKNDFPRPRGSARETQNEEQEAERGYPRVFHLHGFTS